MFDDEKRAEAARKEWIAAIQEMRILRHRKAFAEISKALEELEEAYEGVPTATLRLNAARHILIYGED